MKVDKPRSARNEKIIPPGPSQVKALAAAASEPLLTMLLITACTGLRSGEIRALRHFSVDLDKGVVNVTHSIDADHDEVERHPKSDAAIRSILLSDYGVELLQAHRERSFDWKPTDLVFPREDGHHLSNKFFMEALGDLEDSYTLPPPDVPGRIGVKQLHWHGLRHFAISAWIYANFNIKAVQAFAGHSDIRMTMDRYGHLFPDEDQRDKMNKASSLFRMT